MARNTRQIEPRNKFIILTNGRRTEKNYFDLLKTKRSIYEVVVKYLNDDPIQLVAHAKEYKDANQVWCVFDIDNTFQEGKLLPALIEARKNNINIAYSNVAFEVWLISHYKKCGYAMDTRKHSNELNEILKSVNANKVYSKADETLLKQYFIPKYKNAIVNAKIVHQTFIKAYNEEFNGYGEYPIWEWNSCTTVYELIEALQLKD